MESARAQLASVSADEFRGVVTQTDHYSVQYSAYYSAHSNASQFHSAHTTGFDTSVYFPTHRLEVGTSYQRFLDPKQINSEAAYFSWQPSRCRWTSRANSITATTDKATGSSFIHALSGARSQRILQKC